VTKPEQSSATPSTVTARKLRDANSSRMQTARKAATQIQTMPGERKRSEKPGDINCRRILERVNADVGFWSAEVNLWASGHFNLDV
jgi:hypothetical protein